MSADQKILDRIMALFAKAERTEFQAEAEAFTAKAFELMAKHAVEQSHLVGLDKPKFVKQVININTKGMPQRILFTAAAKANDVASFMLSGKTHMVVVGLPDDIALTQALYTSLLMQMESSLSRENKPVWEHGKTFNHSFRLAFASRISKRFEDLKAAASMSTPGSDIVLRDKASNTAQAVAEMVGATRTVKASANSLSGHVAGQQAGNRANLGQTGVSNSSSRTALV